MKTAKLLLFTLFAAINSYGQYYKQYNTSSGLISNNIYHINSDKSGNLWFVSDKGAVKYDGQNFEVFTTENGLSDNEIYNTYEDLYNRIWFFASNGKLCYYREGEIYNSNNDSLINKLPRYSFVNAMFHNPVDSSLYIAPVNGPLIVANNNSIKTLQCNLSTNSKIRSLFLSDSTVTLTTLHNRFVVNDTCLAVTDNNTIYESYYNNGYLSIVHNDKLELYKNDSLIWETTDKDVLISKIYDAYYDTQGYLLCGTRNGLVVFDLSNNNKYRFFDNTRITSTAIDIHGNYWLSSLGKGIFKLYQSNISGIKRLASTEEKDIIVKKSGQVFIKDKTKIDFLSTVKGKVIQTRITDHFNKKYEPVYANDSIFFYWHVNKFNYTYSYNRNTHLTSKYPKNHFYESHKTGANTYLLTNKAEIKHVRFLENNFHFIDSFYIEHGIYSPNFIEELNRYYYFSTNVLYCYNVNSGKLNAVDTINELSGNRIMIYNAGNVYLFSDNRLRIYDTSNSFLFDGNNTLGVPIYSITKLKNQNYIINTSKGYQLATISKNGNISNTQLIHYPIEQNDILSIFPIDSFLLCNTKSGLYSFSQAAINKKRSEPKLNFEHISVDGVRQNTVNKKLIAKENATISVTLSSKYFLSGKLLFRYRIIDDNRIGQWNETHSKEISFDLNKGEYTIQFQTLTENATPSDIISFNVTIKPTFFTSVSFYSICFIVIIIIVVLVFKYYIARKKKAFADEMEHMQLEHKAINSLLNPHFIFNAINNIQNLINQNSKDEANEYLATLSVMIRQNVQNLQYSVIPLKKELDLIDNYIELQNLRFGNKIIYRLTNNTNSNYHIPPLLLHTFVENAIVHGFDRESNLLLKININTDDRDYLTITITDNGVGITATQQVEKTDKNKTSLGISFSEKRLKRLSTFYNVNYQLQLKDRLDVDSTNGTIVTIMLYARFYDKIQADNIYPLIN